MNLLSNLQVSKHSSLVYFLKRKTAQLTSRKQRYHEIYLNADLDIKPTWVNIFIVVFYLVPFPQTSTRMARPGDKNL